MSPGPGTFLTSRPTNAKPFPIPNLLPLVSGICMRNPSRNSFPAPAHWSRRSARSDCKSAQEGFDGFTSRTRADPDSCSTPLFLLSHRSGGKQDGKHQRAPGLQFVARFFGDDGDREPFTGKGIAVQVRSAIRFGRISSAVLFGTMPEALRTKELSLPTL